MNLFHKDDKPSESEIMIKHIRGKGIEIGGHNTSLEGMAMISLEGFMHLMLLIERQHEPDCNCEEVVFLKKILEGIKNVSTEMREVDAKLKEMFENEQARPHGKE